MFFFVCANVQGELLHYTPMSELAGAGLVKWFYIKVLNFSQLLNALIDLNYSLSGDRYWSEILFSSILTPGHDQ